QRPVSTSWMGWALAVAAASRSTICGTTVCINSTLRTVNESAMFMAGLLADGVCTAAQLQPYPREAFLVSRPPLQLTNTSLVTRTRTVGYAHRRSATCECESALPSTNKT